MINYTCTKSRKPSHESANDGETVRTAESMSLSGPGYSRPKSSFPPEVINSFEKEQKIKNQFLQSEPKIKQNKLRDDEKQGHDLSITSLVKRMEQVNETTAEKSGLNPNALSFYGSKMMENLECGALIAAFENDSSSTTKQGK